MPFILYPRPKAEGDDDVHEQSRLVGDCCRNGIMDISYEKGDMVALTRGSSGCVCALWSVAQPSQNKKRKARPDKKEGEK